ncbi:hypothetical protein [Gracilibacillus suaedae]|uniref:hypothetical protein n=1 Tax=Gracilibacillus suaedae TaxID=2820273 RepID=UPI001ABEA750|nr:hypothetical protein [Gracilibacillus suaedae]
MNLYLHEGEPSQEVLDVVAEEIELSKDIPQGIYHVYLHDNQIDKTRANGRKESSISLTYPNEMIKND